MPKVMTANLLRSGDVVYLGAGNAWVRNLSDARVADDSTEADALEAFAAEAIERRDVISTYLFDVDLQAGRPVAKSVRETIRAAHGPTVVPVV
ncbi:MAG: DUF2849 domain-containing protein [Pseudomonadota bacterium]